MQKPFWKRIGVGLLGLAAALLAAELLLRFVGFAYERAQNRTAGGHGKTSTVLCVGDSFTYGVGASSGAASYPEQLSSLLRRSGGTYQALNRGVPTANTTQLLGQFAGELEKARPAAVIILAGSANIWNMRGAWQLGDGPAKAWLRDRLFRLSVYKFYAYARQSLRARRISAKDAAATGNATAQPRRDGLRGQAYDAMESMNFALAEKLYKRIVASDKKDGYSWAALSNAYFAQDKNSLALLAAMEGLNAGADNQYRLHFCIGKYFALQWNFSKPDGNYLSATYWLEKAAAQALSAGDQETAGRILWDLAYRYHLAGERKRGLAFVCGLTMPQEQKNNLTAFLDTPDLDPKIERWLAHDIGVMAELARKAGATVFIANFPCNDSYLKINQQLRGLARRLNAPLIDNDAVFSDLKAREPDFQNKYFIRDGHCNDLGYSVMAGNAYRVLSAHGFR